MRTARPSPRRREAPALLGVLASVALVAGCLLGIVAGTAAPANAATGRACVRPPASSDNTLDITGCLTDSRFHPAKPVSGVRITVTDDNGAQVGKTSTDATGIFTVKLPGTSDQILGHTYTVHIDTSSLPKGTTLRDPHQKALKVTFNLESDRFVTFPIGPAPQSEGWFTQGLQLAVGGIVFSLLLAMASLGLSMIYGTTGLTNFAHGEMVTLGALAAYWVDRLPGTVRIGGVNVTLATGVIAAVLAGVVFGWLQDKALWRPLRRRSTGLIAAMIVSIGFSIFLRNVFQYVAGADVHNYSQWTSPNPWHLGPIDMTPKDVAVIGFSVVVLVLTTLALQFTRIGKATRAVADNPALAASSGINVDRVIAVVWSAGGGLAGLAGVLLGMTQGFDYQLGFKILLLMFSAVILGGLGTAWGAILGSIIIGIFVEVSTLVVPAELKFAVALVILIIVLLVRPQGILGRAERVG